MAYAADLVRQMLQTQPFVGKRVVACLPRQHVSIHNVRLPLIPAAELSAAVDFEARNNFPVDVANARLATQDVALTLTFNVNVPVLTLWQASHV